MLSIQIAHQISQAKAATAAANDALTAAGNLATKLLQDHATAFIKIAEKHDVVAAAEKALAKAKDEAAEAEWEQAIIRGKVCEAQEVAFVADRRVHDAQIAEKLLIRGVNSPRDKLSILCGGVLELGTLISLESKGDKWQGFITKDGFLVNGTLYQSPGQLCTAHASRITQAHPKPTKPGSGWVYIMVEGGQHKGKTIQKAFNDHFGL